MVVVVWQYDCSHYKVLSSTLSEMSSHIIWSEVEHEIIFLEDSL
jgi:hypothetical protein